MRLLRSRLPKLSHYFPGFNRDDWADMRPAELDVFITAVDKAPPIGWVYLAEPPR